jgi:hypothetical protein
MTALDKETPAPRRPGGPGAQKGPPEKTRQEKIQQQLDEALADSFPASDPVSIVTSHQEEDWGDPEADKPGASG